MSRRVYVLVRAGRGSPAAAAVRRWVRTLLPAAVLVTAPAVVPAPADADDPLVITIDAEDAEAGPLAIADAIGRAGEHRPDSSWPGEDVE